MNVAVGNVVEYRPRRVRADFTAYMGMVIFLGSWAMMFGGLFFAYGVVRSRLDVWPPPDQARLPLLLPGLNTLVMGLSSLALHRAVRALGGARVRAGAKALALAAALGALFLVLQAVVWVQLYRSGLVPSSGPYASAFYALTCLHALHVLVGLLALAGLVWRAFRGAYSAARHLPVRLWAMYWHFVGVVWLLMFVSVYVI